MRLPELTFGDIDRIHELIHGKPTPCSPPPKMLHGAHDKWIELWVGKWLDWHHRPACLSRGCRDCLPKREADERRQKK
jgi:hypothetical protein